AGLRFPAPAAASSGRTLGKTVDTPPPTRRPLPAAARAVPTALRARAPPPPPERIPHPLGHALPLLGCEDLLHGAERLGDLAACGLDLRLELGERAHLLRAAHAVQPLAQRLAPRVQLLLERGRDLLDRRDLLRGQSQRVLQLEQHGDRVREHAVQQPDDVEARALAARRAPAWAAGAAGHAPAAEAARARAHRAEAAVVQRRQPAHGEAGGDGEREGVAERAGPPPHLAE